MTEKELRGLSRAELLEILTELSKENEALQAQVNELNVRLNSIEIRMPETGSISSATNQIRDIFDEAERRAAPYLEAIKSYAVFSDSRQREAEVSAAKIMAEAQWSAQKQLNEAEKNAQLIIMRAKQDAEEHWLTVSQKIDRFWSEYKGLQKYLDIDTDSNTE